MSANRLRFIRIGVVIASVITCLASFAPVSAIDDPDVGPLINAVYAFRNASSPGDMLFVVDETTFYSELPSENAFSAFTVSLIDEDTITVIATVPLTVFHTAGYGRSIAMLYFNAENCTDNSMVWLDSFVISIDGNPALSWPGAAPSDTETTINWSTYTNQSLVQSELSTLIVNLAEMLDISWETVGTSDSLIANTTDGQKLSDIGMSYFNGVLPGLSTIAPDAFYISVTSPVIHKRTYGSGGMTGLAGQLTGTPFDLTGVATSLGLTLGWLNAVIVLIIIVAIDYFMVKKQLSTKGIILVDSFVFIIAAAMGVLPLLIVLGGAVLCILAIVNVFFFSKAST